MKISANANEDLLQAVVNGNLKSVAITLNKGGISNFRDRNNKPILSIAAKNGDLEIVELLLQKGAKINAIERNKKTSGWTALMHSTEGGHFEIVKLLLKNGANKNTKNGKGYNALYLAKLWGHNNIISLLEEESKNEKKYYQSEKYFYPKGKII